METKRPFLGRIAMASRAKTAVTTTTAVEISNYQTRIAVTQQGTILVFITVSSAMAVCCSSDRR